MPRSIRPFAPADVLRDARTGRLTRPARIDALAVPKSVGLRGDHMRFKWSWQELDLVPVPSDLLEQFLALHSVEDVLAFARRFGPLLIDASQYQKLWVLMLDEGLVRAIRTMRLNARKESFEAWERTRRQFAAIIRLVVSLREDERPDADAIRELTSLEMIDLHTQVDGAEWARHSAREQRERAAIDLTYHLSTLADVCGLRPVASVSDWAARPLRFELLIQDRAGEAITANVGRPGSGALSLFGALLAQLMATVTVTGFAVCAGCGAVYVPKRKPRAGESNYCESCGRTAAVRAAKARYVARQRKKGRKR
jgi:hypothetical protein